MRSSSQKVTKLSPCKRYILVVDISNLSSGISSISLETLEITNITYTKFLTHKTSWDTIIDFSTKVYPKTSSTLTKYDIDFYALASSSKGQFIVRISKGGSGMNIINYKI